MAGHSKWKNIREKKGKTDAQRGKIFTKLSRELIVAVKEGGADPSSNARLRDAISKARSANVPNDNIKRVIEKAAGSSDNTRYETNIYEGYGPGGVAVIVETMTDNKNRTAAEVRHYFDKYGGNLGTDGCVSWSFTRKGVIIIDNEAGNIDEETLLLEALEAGADDLETGDNMFAVYTTADAFSDVRFSLEEKGYSFLSAQIELVPQNYIKLDSDDEKIKFEKMISLFEDNDDVQNVFHNLEDS